MDSGDVFILEYYVEMVCAINMVTPTVAKYNLEKLHTLGTAVVSYSTRHLNQV